MPQVIVHLHVQFDLEDTLWVCLGGHFQRESYLRKEDPP